MKITINVEPSAKETSLLVTCKELTPQVEKLLAAIRILDKQITANKGDAVCLINLADVFYIEALERKTFIYTDKEAKEGDLVFALTTGNMTHSYPPVCKAELTLIF